MKKHKWECRMLKSDREHWRVWRLYRVHNFISGWIEEYTEEEIARDKKEHSDAGMDVEFRKCRE